MSYILILIFSIGLFSLSVKANKYIFNEKENILISIFIFSFFFSLIYLLSSYSFILNIKIKYLSIIFVIGIFFYFFLEIKNIWINSKKYFNNLIVKNKLIFLIIFFYFLIVLLPIADEDSLRYHLPIAQKINNGTFYNNTWFDYITLGAQEFVTSFFLNINFAFISSSTNFIFLIFAILSNIYILKKYKTGSGILSSIILLSSPYLVALVSSQKYYLFPCYIVSYSIAYLYLEKKISSIATYLILTLNIFCVIIKPTFLPYLILTSIWLLVKKENYKNKIFYIITSIFIFILFYFPIFLIKLKIYNDPLLPYFSINSENTEWLSEFNHMLTGYNMDFTDRIDNLLLKYLLIPLKLFFPLQISDLFKTLGLGLIFIFSFSFDKDKKLLGLTIFFILSVIILNNYQSRWFLPLLIFVSIFANVEKFKILKKFTLLQLFGVSLILLPMSAITLGSNIGLLSKKNVLGKIFQASEMIEHINKNYKDEQIFTNLNYFYYFDSVIPVYYPKTVVKFNPNFYKNNQKNTNLILWKKTKTGNDLNIFIENNFTCKKLKKIEEFDFYPGRFYGNPKRTKKTTFTLFRLSC